MTDSTLGRPGAARFWLAVVLTGAGTGLAAAALTRLLELVQRVAWNGSGTNGVPLGGALFALEVMRGMLALRFVLPALLASTIATAISWIALPDAPTYVIPSYSSFGVQCDMGAAGRPDSGRGFGRLCATCPLG